jgi:hypothetical protein
MGNPCRRQPLGKMWQQSSWKQPLKALERVCHAQAAPGRSGAGAGKCYRHARERSGLMQCPQCQCEHTETARFCEECGVRLVRACPGCGQEVRARAKFCPECGTPLSGPPAPPLTQTDRPRQTQEQRPTTASPEMAAAGKPRQHMRYHSGYFCRLCRSSVSSDISMFDRSYVEEFHFCFGA